MLARVYLKIKEKCSNARPQEKEVKEINKGLA